MLKMFKLTSLILGLTTWLDEVPHVEIVPVVGHRHPKLVLVLCDLLWETLMKMT